MTPAGTMSPGQVLGGDFVIERALGAGGMGAVYVARQLSTQRHRAIKTMHARLLSDPSLRARFAREARISSMIESDHVVEVVGAGIDEASDTPWIAMELLQGDDLARYVAKRGRLSPDELRSLFDQTGHALAAAHRAGVVHRDLKPANLFLSAPRRPGVPFMVKVLDFGIAKILDAQTSKATTSIIGSPLWMAPEQTDASAPVGPWTDVWTFGLIAFWALTGKSYWRAANAAEASIPAVIRELVVDPLVSASERATFLGVGDRVPHGFDAWLARCLQRDVAARFRSGEEAVAALREVLRGAAPRASAVPATVAMSEFPMGGGPAALGAVMPTLAAGGSLTAPMLPSHHPGTLAPAVAGSGPWRPIHPAPASLHPVAVKPRRRAAPWVLGALLGASAAAFAAWGLTHHGPSSAHSDPGPPLPPVTVSTQPVAQAPAPAQRPPAAAPHQPAPVQAPSTAPDASPAATPEASKPPVEARSGRRRRRRVVPGGGGAARRCNVRAGPLWSNQHAQQVCPRICTTRGAQRFTGQWRTVTPGVMSVCECEAPRSGRCPR